MYDIALISTNGDEDLANELKVIYNNFGLDVYIDVKPSLTGETYIKEINGMVLENGYMDTTFVNNPETNTCELPNPEIYAFQDPIDTLEMGSYLDMIIEDNIPAPARDKKFDKVVPTVIIAPRLSKDFLHILIVLFRVLLRVRLLQECHLILLLILKEQTLTLTKISLLFVDVRLSKKYMDPDIQARDIERGDAININDRSTIHAMSGSAERVVSDNSKTTFINPCMMYDEDGYTSEIFNQKIDWLESEIKKETAEAKETVTVYNLKKRDLTL